MKHLILLNDPPYGTERSFNGLRMAHALAKHALAKNDPDADITVFLMADAVLCAKAGQKTPDGYYNLERMIRRVLTAKGRVLMCGTCMDARGLAEGDMMEGPTRSTTDELAQATLKADKVLVF
ncbi:MAG: DsrE/DsrF/TusD sulfur relay family protein [Pseudodonghicola sp.]